MGAHTIESAQGRNVYLECPACYNKFPHVINTTTGDPRNIALIGHWDGWQPFSTSSNHSSGEIVALYGLIKAYYCVAIQYNYLISFSIFKGINNDNYHSRYVQ